MDNEGMVAVRKRWPWAIVALAAVLVAVIAGWPVFVDPQVDELHKADAIFVLGGTGEGRYTAALEFGLAGLAPQVVMSNPVGADDTWLTDLCAHQRYSFVVSCFEPDPPTTRGEARELRRRAQEEGWHSVIVVTYLPHISRARYIVQRCFDGDLAMADSQEAITLSDWVSSYAYQTVGFVRAFSQSGC